MKGKIHKKTVKKITWEENKVLRMVLIVVMVLFLGVMLGVIGYALTKNYQYSRIVTSSLINTSVEVKYGYMGLNADKDALRYGKISPGNSGIRYLNISTKERAIVNIYIYGEMANFLNVEDNGFIMDPGYKLIAFNIYIPYNTTEGNYTGQIRVELLRP